jgi:21S rRNA (GM2251-2'-O)-methyltransferase
MDIYSTTNLVKFLKASHANGWQVVGAAGDADPSITPSQLKETTQQPVILVLGNEGTGLRTNVKNGCNLFVSIPKATQDNEFNGSVDSLNVGVAAGVLISSALCV